MTKVLTVEGMTCGNCKRHVEEALREVDGVASAEVDLGAKSARVDASDSVSEDSLKGAVEEAGYTVTAVAEG
jgi:copper chaperone CopZ